MVSFGGFQLTLCIMVFTIYLFIFPFIICRPLSDSTFQTTDSSTTTTTTMATHPFIILFFFFFFFLYTILLYLKLHVRITRGISVPTSTTESVTRDIDGGFGWRGDGSFRSTGGSMGCSGGEFGTCERKDGEEGLKVFFAFELVLFLFPVSTHIPKKKKKKKKKNLNFLPSVFRMPFGGIHIHVERERERE
jgi:hypothetical protein